MIKLSIEAEDLSNIVEITLKYSEMSLKKRSVISVNIEGNSITLQNEIVQLKFPNVINVIENNQNIKGFAFDAKSISKLKYPDKTVFITFNKNTVYVKSGKLETNTKSDFSYENYIDRKIETSEQIEIENQSLLKAINKVNLPFSFYKGDSNKSPIQIKGIKETNTVLMSASDGFSLCQFSTKGEVKGDFEIKIPRIIFSSFLNKKLEKTGKTKIEVQDMAVRISSGSISIVTAQINEKVDSFDVIAKENSDWVFKAKLVKEEISMAIKSISGSMPDKKGSVNYIQCKVNTNESKFDLCYTNTKSGVSYTGIDMVLLENKNPVNTFIVNLHAKSFEEFTKLLEKEFIWCASKRAIMYTEENIFGNISYIFPTINI